VLAVPNQRRGVAATYGLTRAELDRQAWAVEPSGRTYGGAAAINRVLAELDGPWHALSRVYGLPVVTPLEDLVYRWVAAHRQWFARWGARPECGEPTSDCE
jgi:predicted DCC family thiol-disulfide oxidoreductase YuxK